MRATNRVLVALAIFTASLSTSAQQSIGSWLYEVKAGFYAATISESGNIFGQWCFLTEGSCIYLIGLPTGCKDDASYPVLINADSGALSTTMICRGKIEGRALYRYVFGNFDEIDAAVRASKRIGIAMPLEGDQFRVSRFSLDGANESLKIMRAAAERAQKVKDTKSTKDQIL